RRPFAPWPMARPCRRRATSRNSGRISTRWCGASVEAVLFYVFAVGTLAGSAMVVLRRNPIHGAVSLVGAFFFLAGIYVLLSAHLIAILQIMVYAGAVMVLFVFVIMLLNLKEEELGEFRFTFWKVAGVVSVLIGVGVIG